MDDKEDKPTKDVSFPYSEKRVNYDYMDVVQTKVISTDTETFILALGNINTPMVRVNTVSV